MVATGEAAAESTGRPAWHDGRAKCSRANASPPGDPRAHRLRAAFQGAALGTDRGEGPGERFHVPWCTRTRAPCATAARRSRRTCASARDVAKASGWRWYAPAKGRSLDAGQIHRHALWRRHGVHGLAVHLQPADADGGAGRHRLQRVTRGNRARHQRAGHDHAEAFDGEYTVDRQADNAGAVQPGRMSGQRSERAAQVVEALPGDRRDVQDRRALKK
jgi:hypothetical protein